MKNSSEGSDKSSMSSDGSGAEENRLEEAVGNTRSLGRVRRQYRRLGTRTNIVLYRIKLRCSILTAYHSAGLLVLPRWR